MFNAFYNIITLCWIFLKVGLFSFGGGLAMLPLIYQSVMRFGVVTSVQFSNLVALSQVTPGPIAVNAATYVGLESAGIPGAFIASACVCLPGFAVVIIVIKLLDKFKNSRFVSGAFAGIRPVTAGLIAASALFIADGVLTAGPVASAKLLSIDYYNFIPIAIFAASILLMILTKIKPVYVMLLMGAAGLVIYGFVM